MILFLEFHDHRWDTYRSKNCTPLMEAMPMYRNTPNSTDIGMRRKMGAIVTDNPTISDTKKPDILCSFTSVMCGASPGACVLLERI